ncbi:MAG: gamma-glutamyltransferase [Halovenus sp.]
MRRRRREILLGGGVIGATGLAGCTGLFDRDTSDADSGDDGTQDAPPEQETPTEDDPGDTAGNTPAAAVSNHHLATEAGLDVLDDGGTAADAAVAVASVLSVVEPWFSSVLGGGTWALYYDAGSDTVTSLDGVGPVGSEATPGDYRSRGLDPGMHQAIVPGAWDGWMLWLDEYGNLELDDVLSPAVEIARRGYPVSSEMARWLDIRSSRIDFRPAAGAIYKPDGELLREGDTVYQREMADTFESLLDAYDERRANGRSRAIQAARDRFYRGPIAESIVEFSDQNDGYLTLPDFNDFEARIVDPLSIDYDDEIRVYQNPPNSQGITMLLALNVLKGYDMSAYDPGDADAIHLQAEAIKLAFADRYHHVGDPDRINVPVADLLGEEYADRQRNRIDMDQAMEWPIDSGLTDSSATDVEADHTTTFHVTDEEGNAAAVTTSLGAQFLVVGDTGIHINNRMRMISTEEGDPNRLTPGYKVRHTSNPYMAFRNGHPYILGGNTGVDTQPQGQTQQFLHAVEFGLSAQEAVARPRFVSTAFPSGTIPYRVRNTLQMESDFPESVIEDLRERGHDVEVGAGIFGTANMILVEEDGETLQIGAEPRASTAEGDVLPTE